MASDITSSISAYSQSFIQSGKEMIKNNKEWVMARLSFDRSTQSFGENEADNLYGRSRYAFLTKL